MSFLGIKWRKVFSMHMLRKAVPELTAYEIDDILRLLAEEVAKRREAAGMNRAVTWTDTSGYTFTIGEYKPPRED